MTIKCRFQGRFEGHPLGRLPGLPRGPVAGRAGPAFPNDPGARAMAASGRPSVTVLGPRPVKKRRVGACAGKDSADPGRGGGRGGRPARDGLTCQGLRTITPPPVASGNQQAPHSHFSRDSGSFCLAPVDVAHHAHPACARRAGGPLVVPFGRERAGRRERASRRRRGPHTRRAGGARRGNKARASSA